MFRVCATALSVVLLTGFQTPDDGDDQYQYLFGLQREGMHELVVKEARAFLRDYPEHEKIDLARYRLALSLFELDQFETAAQSFTALTALDDFEFGQESWFRLGQCLLDLGQYSEASTAFERTAEGKGDYLSLAATFLLGEARFQEGEFERASRAYALVLSADDNDEYARDAAYGQSWCAFRLERFDAAARHVRSFLKTWSEDELADELNHLLGEAEMALGHPKEALAAYRSVVQGESRASALHGAGFALAKLGDHLEAARSFATLIDEYPSHPLCEEAALHLGIHLIEVDEHQNALTALHLPQVKLSPELYYWRARAHFGLGEHEPALQALTHAREANPSSELAERIDIARGDLLIKLGRAEEASRAYAKSESEYALYAAAMAHFRADDHEGAARLASLQLERFPTGEYSRHSQLTLGEALFALENYEAALEAFRTYLSGAAQSDDSGGAENHQARVRLGWCAFLLEDWAVAADAFAKASVGPDVSPLQAEALYMEARARDKQGRVEEAERAFVAYLEHYGDGVYAANALMSLAGYHSGEAGVRYLERLVREFPASDEAPLALNEWGERLLDIERFEDSRSIYRRLRVEYPNHELVAAATYGEAWACFALGVDEQSIELLRDFDRLAAPSTTLGLAALELRIFAADRMGRGELALQAWKPFASNCSDEDRLLACARTVAGLLERSEDYKSARAVMAEATRRLQLPANVAAARVEGAWLALSAKDLSGAKSELTEALSIAPKEPAVCEAAFFLGEARYEQGEDAEAIKWYRAAAEEGSPVADRALYMQGFARLRQKENQRAAASFQELVDRFDSSDLMGESLYLVGEAHFRDERFAESTRALGRLLEEYPGHSVASKALYRLGVAHCRLEQWRAGRSALADLARRFPEFEHGADAELWRGRALAAEGSSRAARQAFARVLKRDEGIYAARARLELGQLALAEDDVETALSEFLKVALLFGYEEEVAEAWLMSGQCLELQGKSAQAREQYKSLLEKYPNSSSADEALRRLER